MKSLSKYLEYLMKTKPDGNIIERSITKGVRIMYRIFNPWTKVLKSIIGKYCLAMTFLSYETKIQVDFSVSNSLLYLHKQI